MIKVEEQGLDHHDDNQLDCNFITAASWTASLPLVASSANFDLCILWRGTGQVIFYKGDVERPSEVVHKVETKKLVLGCLQAIMARKVFIVDTLA